MFLILLGVIFLIASRIEDMILGAVLVMIAVMLLLFIYRSQKIEAAKPTLVTQNFDVKMEGSGTMEQKELRCKTCGAPLSEKNLKVVEGGVVMVCPYCNTVTSLQESPKW
jgi:DNA-directed RNA polymerase subunit RPC12/RpoP